MTNVSCYFILSIREQSDNTSASGFICQQTDLLTAKTEMRFMLFFAEQDNAKGTKLLMS